MPREVSVQDEDTTIIGGVYVMNGPKTEGIWPLQATLPPQAGSAAGMTVRVLFGDRAPQPTPTNKEGRFDVHRLHVPASIEEWRFSLLV